MNIHSQQYYITIIKRNIHFAVIKKVYQKNQKPSESVLAVYLKMNKNVWITEPQAPTLLQTAGLFPSGSQTYFKEDCPAVQLCWEKKSSMIYKR